jgi:uncharacterized membrane protein YhaH (DUF805 family)
MIEGRSLLQLLSLRGRIGRMTWWATLAVVALLKAFAEHSQGVHDTGVAFLGLVSAVLCLWLVISSGVKRLHDLDRSGWWFMLCAIPIVGQVVMTIWLGFFSGTLKPNQYGEPPRAWWKR